MSWQVGLIVVIVFAIVLPWALAEIASTFGSQDDWDQVAARKRQIERNARKQSREFQ